MLFVVQALLFAALATAERLIQTSALISCMSGSQVNANNFNVVFYPKNGTAIITTSITSSIEGNFSAHLTLYAYGINILEKQIKNCDIADTLCPMSAGHFDVDTEYHLDTDIVNDIPGIAYTFPDLDAVVKVQVYQLDSDGNITDEMVACVEAYLDNTKTVRTVIVSWVLFGLIIFFVAMAGLMALLGHYSTSAHIVADIVSLFGFFQSVAIMSMMAVERLPPIAASWAQNLMWTMGVMSVEFMQSAINWYIVGTGGTPSLVVANKNLISVAVYKRAMMSAVDHASEQLHRLINRVPGAADIVLNPLHRRYVAMNSNYTTTNEKDEALLSKTLVLTGIKRVAYKANIEITNLFVTGIVFFLFIGICLIFICVAAKVTLELLVKANSIKKDRCSEFRASWHVHTKGILFRYFYVAFSMLSVLCLFEFTQRESVATVVDAAFIYGVILTVLLYATVRVIMLGRESTRLFKNPAYILYGNSDILNRWGFLYVQFRATAYYFIAPLIFVNFVRAAVISLGQANGKVQSVIIFVVELIFLVLVCVLKPFMDKRTNGFNIAIAVVMFVNSILFMLFSQIFPNTLAASSISALVFFIINVIFSLVLLLMIIASCLWALFRKNPDARYQPMTDDRAVFRRDSRDASSNNELAEMADAARDGYRESFLHTDDAEPAGSDPFKSKEDPYRYQAYNDTRNMI